MKNITTIEMEIALAGHFGWRKNIIVPNLSWGAGLYHECDLFIINRSGYATEIEIKISRSDLRKDFEKKHRHHSNKVKYFYYAVPEKLRDLALELIPGEAGLIVCKRAIQEYYYSPGVEYINVRIDKPAVKRNLSRKLSDQEIANISRLGTMRIWKLKQKVIKQRDEIKLLKQKVNN